MRILKQILKAVEMKLKVWFLESSDVMATQIDCRNQCMHIVSFWFTVWQYVAICKFKFARHWTMLHFPNNSDGSNYTDR